uniref:DDE-1 domain-containing protein n=1 Tax=Trichuris muris TaxID=70415 RepID=A0A5S6QGU9_TRIMR
MLNRYLCSNFNATSLWCSSFMKRKDLVIRQKTNIAQKLPVDLEEQLFAFQRHVINLRKEHQFPMSCIGNMDETPMNFDMVGNKTVDSKGVKTVVIRSTGHEKARFTVVLSCMADGTKLEPMVIFKRKRKPNIRFLPGVFVHFHENGWMDAGGLRLWIDNVWKKRPGHVNNGSLLVWDSFRGQAADKITSYVKKCKIETAVIPGGLTSVLQPLDVCLNKPFKDHMREEWNNWMVNGQKSYTAGGCMRAPPLEILCQFIINAWSKIKKETVIKSFKKCSISNALDGTEDDELWDSDEYEGNSDESTSDSPDEQLGSEQEASPEVVMTPATKLLS